MKEPIFVNGLLSRLDLEPGDALSGSVVAEKDIKLENVCQTCRERRRGAAAVEFAIVAPVFFLMIFGMIEFGRMIMVQQIITNASREGTRIAILEGTTDAEIVTAVERCLEGGGISGAEIDVSRNPPELAEYGEPVSVMVSIPFSKVSWLPSPMFGLGDRVMTASTVMRRETVQ